MRDLSFTREPKKKKKVLVNLKPPDWQGVTLTLAIEALHLQTLTAAPSSILSQFNISKRVLTDYIYT